jgi:small subunit ribosomal protein S2
MVKIQDLLESGVHFGHRVTKWNPRMAPFIFGERNGIHIIDLVQTLQYLNEISNFLKDFKRETVRLGERNSRPKEILLVGTKKQASSLVQNMAETLNINFQSNGNDGSRAPFHAHYVNHRWLGGLLTNWETMRLCIEQLNTLEGRETSGETDALPKKERAILKKQTEKLQKYFGGIKSMKDKPSLVIIVGQDFEMNAVRECQKIQNMMELRDGTNSLRTITLLDTNCDPSLADLFVPANDDSTKSIEVILNTFTQALSVN